MRLFKDAGWDAGGHRYGPTSDVAWPAPALAADPKLAASFITLGLEIVGETRGPMRLWDFARRLGSRLGMPPLPLGDLCDAVKSTLSAIDDPRLRILAPGMPGAGYVYDAADPDAQPVRASR